MEQQNFILKILSGTHVGAEIILTEQETTLGRGEDCDLVLDDVSLAEKHISLRTTEHGVELNLLAEDSTVYVDGEKLETEQVVLQAFQVVAIGTLFFATGPSDQPWPAIDLLLENKLAKPEVSETPEEAEVDSEDGNKEQETTAAAGEESGSKLPSETKKKGLRLYLVAIAGISLVSFGALIFWLLLPSTEMRLQTENQNAGHLRYLNQNEKEQVLAIGKQYQTILEVKENPNTQTVEIVGYAKNEKQRDEIIKQLQQIKPNIPIRIVSAEETIASIMLILNRLILNQPGNQVRVTQTLPTGNFALEGYVADIKQWTEVLAVIRRDVKNYARLKDLVETKGDRLVVLQQMLNKAGLADQIKIQQVEKGLALSGTLQQPEQRTKLIEIKNTFNQQFNKMPFVDWVEETSQHHSSIELNIRSVGFGITPHLVLKNGRRYLVGSELDNGYTIKAITTKFIALQKGSDIAYYYLQASK